MSEKNKTVVLYRSKSGFTKKYAEWLAEELNCKLLAAEQIKVSDLSVYDTIIYGGGVYASTINGVKMITGNLDQLKGKKIIVFAVGSSPVKEDNTQQLINTNIPENQRDQIKFYYLRGGFDYTKLSRFNKFAMNLLKPMLKKKNADDDQNNLLAAFDQPQDFTDKKNLTPILEIAGQ